MEKRPFYGSLKSVLATVAFLLIVGGIISYVTHQMQWVNTAFFMSLGMIMWYFIYKAIDKKHEKEGTDTVYGDEFTERKSLKLLAGWGFWFMIISLLVCVVLWAMKITEINVEYIILYLIVSLFAMFTTGGMISKR